jgi:hypothetical protein
MSLRKILSLVGPMAWAACLAMGYAMVEQWIALVVIELVLPAWLLARIRPATMSPSIPLVVSVGIAAAGLFAGAAPVLMIFGATLALASWDLVLLDHSLAGCSNSSAATLSLFEHRHLQSLTLALGLGLLVAVIGRTLHLQIPFGGMICLALLALFSLDRILRALIDSR